MNGLKDKVVVCTGSGRVKGLGAAIVRRLAEEGCRVVITDLGEATNDLTADNIGATAEMEQVANEVRELGAECITVPCDVRDEAQVEQLFAKTVEAFGQVDIVVNNAGIGYMLKGFTDVPADEWRIVLDVNLTGAFPLLTGSSEAHDCCRQRRPHHQHRQSGRQVRLPASRCLRGIETRSDRPHPL